MYEKYAEGNIISVGKFLQGIERMYSLSIEISFISGTAFPLNYLVVKGLGMLFDRKCYLEIGSYIGDSIHNVSDICEKCISVTAPIRSPWSMNSYCKKCGINDFSNRLIDTDKVEQYMVNSQHFDFKKISSAPDLILIDGEGTYEGVKRDTLNIKKIKSQKAIILWQLVKRNPTSRIACDGILAGIRDCLTEEEWRDLYLFDNSTLGMFLPGDHVERMREYIVDDKKTLYTYNLDVSVNERKIK